MPKGNPDKLAFDLTNANVSDTFEHLLQVRDTDKTLYDALGNTLDDFRLSGSFTTSEFLEIELNQGNIIHFQNDVFRIEMNLPEFVEFSSHVILGANKLIESKNINVDEITNE